MMAKDRSWVAWMSCLLWFIHFEPCFAEVANNQPSMVKSTAHHHPQKFLKQITGSSNEGGLIVQHYCINCHGLKPMIQIGAPRIGQVVDWKERMKAGLNGLLKHTDEGLNGMPARGGCFECTDKQLMLAIMAMLPNN